MAAQTAAPQATAAQAGVAEPMGSTTAIGSTVEGMAHRKMSWVSPPGRQEMAAFNI